MLRSWPFEGSYLTVGVDRGGRDRCRNPEVWTDSSHGSGAFMEDEPVKIVGDIGQDEFRFGPCDTYGRMNRPDLFFWWAKTCSTWARIDDFAALSRAILCGIGLPAGLRR